MKILRKIKELNVGIKFFILVLCVYLIILFFNVNLFLSSIIKFYELFKSIILSLVVVFLIMFVFNLIFKEKKVKKFFKKTEGWKKYLIVVLAGIFSSGPIYVWYPFLADLKEQGMGNDLVTVFLYNRAVKLPLLPMMVYYFSLKMVLILMVLMIFFSIINGLVVNKLVTTK